MVAKNTRKNIFATEDQPRGVANFDLVSRSWHESHNFILSFKSNHIKLYSAMSPSNSHSNSNSDRAIIIFDWDDTILPSSFVDRVNNLSELPQQFHNLFREIEQCTEKCLAAAAKHGEVSLSLCK